MSMGITLRDAPDYTLKKLFIEACDKVDKTMIKNNIIKVNKS